MRNKTISLAALVLSAWPTIANVEIPNKEPVQGANLENSVANSKGLDLNFIEFRNHKEIHRPIDLNPEKKKQLEEDLSNYLSRNKIENVDQAIAYSMDFVAKSLDFRLDYFYGKNGSGYFKFPITVKVTDCVDYAFLFDKTFKYVASKTGLNAESQVMRSDGYIFGKRLDFHDWVKITETQTGKKHLICPTFYDAGINPNLEKKVK